jgi:nitroimidazol reductase NimA-like FMN-containing flavoprotein (pyridoxamine 5'-phosphate oxidase superfamily)
MSQDDSPVEVLSEKDSWDLLQAHTLGRIATSAAGIVDIFPVNYYADGTSILFRTAPGSKLVELTVNDDVAFELDGYTEREAWSVIVKGTARALDRDSEIETADAIPLKSWLPTLKSAYVRITPHSITGRRFQRGPEPEWWF